MKCTPLPSSACGTSKVGTESLSPISVSTDEIGLKNWDEGKRFIMSSSNF